MARSQMATSSSGTAGWPRRTAPSGGGGPSITCLSTAWLEPEIAALRTLAAQRRAEAQALLQEVEPCDAVDRKRGGWALEDEAAALAREAALRETEWLQTVHGALILYPELPEAHARLADHYRACLSAAELAHRDEDAARFEAQLRAHDRGRHDAFLRGEGAQWALTTRQRERLGGYRLLDNQPGWALVYWDEISAVYLRRDQPQFAEAIRALEYRRFHPWGNPIAELQRPEPGLEALLEFDDEIARFRQTSPDDAMGRLMDCAVARARKKDDATARCDAAETVAGGLDDPRLLRLVQAVRAR